MTEEMQSTIEPRSADSKQGRWVRIALMTLPVGTVLLSIASFGIWWLKKTTVEDRTYAYASALRREMTPEAVTKFDRVAREVLAMPVEDRLPSMAAYLKSSMGAANMGYDVREQRFTVEPVESAIIDVELTGKKRPREVVALITAYGGDLGRVKPDSMALGTLMSLAHSVAGEGTLRTLRFVALPEGLTDPRGRSALEAFESESRGRDERITHVWLLGNLPVDSSRKALRVEQTGCVVKSLPLPESAEAAVEMADELKAALFAEAERL